MLQNRSKGFSFAVRRGGVVPLLIAAVVVGGTHDAAAQTRFRTVFVANSVSDEISVLRVRPDGTLALIGHYPTSDWPTPLDVSADGRFVGVAHASGASAEVLQVHEVAEDGSLTLAGSLVIGDAPLGLQWIGLYKLAVTDSASRPTQVHTYDFDPGTGTKS